jgi:class 3 adenylate cyclase/uncharacterized protein (DUF427 family)
MSSVEAIETVPLANSDYGFTFEPCPKRISAIFSGVVIADSDAVMVLRETRLPDVYYFPREHVRMDLMRPSSLRTHCPFKGNASYWTLEVGDRVARDVMWSYQEPLPEASALQGYGAFYASMMDEWLADGVRIGHGRHRPPLSFTNPLLPWLLSEAPSAPDALALTRTFIDEMLALEIPLWRFNLIVRTLHPQLMAVAYRWWLKRGEVMEEYVSYDMLTRPQYLNSPLAAIIEGAGGIRRRLDGRDPVLDYPVLADLHREGATDYVAMPMTFSDGQVNVITLASSKRDGFSTGDLGHVYEILPVLGRLYEVHAMRYRANTLLDTYLGHHAGRRVLEGHIKRGDGDSIEAVIWFCDLRESTPLAQSMPREQFLKVLNIFFDCMAGTVMEHGGQVLRFIGDAALSIFPIDAGSFSGEQARNAAITAAEVACQRMEAINEERARNDEVPLGFGIALHEGEVTYGNIGTENRLEFTVIGDAANCAARIETHCKVLKRQVLVSEAIAASDPQRFESMGEHLLRGVNRPLALYALRD